MPQYRYRALTREGKEESGVAVYASEALAYASLVGLDLTVVELDVVTGDQENRFVGARVPARRRIPLHAQADLAEQMGLMFAAFLPVGEMLTLLSDSAEDPTVKQSMRRVSQLVADGARFPDAFQTVSAPYSPLFPSLLAVSYSSANPAVILSSLATYLRRQDQLKSQVSAALVYPVILILAAMSIILLLAFYLAPNLAPMFTSLDRPLPGAIAFFLGVREAVVNYWMALPIVMVLIPWICAWLLKRFPSQLKVLAVRIPVFGPAKTALSIARLTRALELLLTSGRPLTESLRDTATFLRDETYASLFLAAAEAIEAGTSASSVFERDTRLPKTFQELFRYGEKTNTLPQVMNSLATSLETNAERQTQSMARLIVPVLTLVVGGGIALLVYSVMTAVLSVSDLSGV